MKLKTLLDEIPQKQLLGDVKDIEIKGIVYDPLRVKPGFLYVAINIYTQLDKIEIPDGHPYLSDAVKNGAVAVVVQKDVDVPQGVVKVKVLDSRHALALLANRFYGYPSRKLKLIGVTGTNGKTTTTHLIESILIQKYKVGLIGTLYYKLQDVVHSSKDTTPEPPDLQEILKQMADREFDYCIMEASSHGIDFHRIEGCNFDAAVFTNLSQDHLDYHKTMENYLRTKVRLFNGLAPDKVAVINTDDPYSDHFIRGTRARVMTYGVQQRADVMAEEIRYGHNRTDFLLKTPEGDMAVRTRLVGSFNVYNTLSAVCTCLSQGVELETIKSGIRQPIRVAGRFELIDKGQDFSVVVDYAHTPDGMENVLKLARSLKPNRLITVFGCGGDRDHEKRPVMGRIASQYSDSIIITADNPRNEDPLQIANDILKGAKGRAVKVIIDRYEAIEHALRGARKGDVVMICGKGHETTQTLKDRVIPFNDAEVAEAILRTLKLKVSNQ